MANPTLKCFVDGYLRSDCVLALIGEAWVEAIYTNHGWFTFDLTTKLDAVTEWRDGQETHQG